MRSDGFIEEEEILVIDFGQVMRALQSKVRWILACTVLCTLLATAAAFFLFREKYQSVGTLLFNPGEVRNVITSIDTEDRFLNGLRSESSPYKNQEELLKSRLIAQRVIGKVNAFNRQLDSKTGQDRIAISAYSPEKLLKKVISADHIKDTDFIQISATATRPQDAKRIADFYLESYLEEMAAISAEPLKRQEKLFKGQVHQAEVDLQAISTRLQEFQQTHHILDINVESQNRVRQMISLNSDTQSIEATLAQKRATVERLRKQLKLGREDVGTVIQAVASGQNDQLDNLQASLSELQRDYDAKALVYAPTNPDMQQIQQKIDRLKTQITDQQILTIGQTTLSGSGVIRDSVRTNLVSRLAEAESDISALQQKAATMRSQYRQLHTALQELPGTELGYAQLQLEKKNKEDILIRLKQKLSEVRIQKAASLEKLRPIDTPSLPERPLFPQRWHIIGLGALLGFLLSAGVTVAHSLLSPRAISPEYIENSLHLPVLAQIPWTPETQWRQYRTRGLLEVMIGAVDRPLLKSYQDLALNLKVQRNATQKNALVLASTLQGAAHSVILANLAVCLAQSGESVLLVDANLRKPRLHEMFNHEMDYERGLPELINGIAEFAARRENPDPIDLLPMIQSSAIPSELHPQLFYLNAGVALENTFEFLNAKAFGVLVQALKAGYDWVLLDAPPFLAQPDAAILLGCADGLLLLVEKSAEEAQVAAVRKKTARLNADIIGAVLRRTE